MNSWGTDPELMLVNESGYVSAIGVVPSSPDNRLNIKGHDFYYDNVLAEFAVKPATNKEQAIEHLRECLEIYNELVNPHKLVAQAYQTYPDNIWVHLHEITGEPIAAVAGCAVDMCAYTVRSMKPPKEIIENTTDRSAGGHVHLGDERLLRDYGLWYAPSILLMDLFLGIPSLFLDKDPTSSKRRSIYGQAGRFRICDYGLEYRTLGNFWLTSPRLTGLIYDLCNFVCDIATDDKWVNKFCTVDKSKYVSSTPQKAYIYNFDVQTMKEAINSSDTKKAKELFEFALDLMPNSLAQEVKTLSQCESFDLYKEWEL